MRPIHLDDVASRYQAGESEQAIAKSFGVSRSVVRRHLREAGVEIRGRSQATALRMAKLTPEERLRLAENAHAAVRGKPQSVEHRVKCALGREANPPPMPATEAEFAALMLSRHGVRMERERAIGPYNMDFALTESRVAVEIYGGNWHASSRHAARHRQRLDYMINAGWAVIVVWITPRWPLTDWAADYVVSLHERRRAGEAGGGQEHVIRGNGDAGPVGEVNPQNGAIVLNFNPGNPTRGENGRFGKKAVGM